MSNPAKIATRTGRPQTIAAAFGGLMRIFGARASDADLVARWAEIMGPEIASIACIAGIRKLRNGRYSIALRAAHPAFALQLSYMQAEITERINNYFGRAAVEKITFRK